MHAWADLNWEYKASDPSTFLATLSFPLHLWSLTALVIPNGV